MCICNLDNFHIIYHVELSQVRVYKNGFCPSNLYVKYRLVCKIILTLIFYLTETSTFSEEDNSLKLVPESR